MEHDSKENNNNNKKNVSEEKSSEALHNLEKGDNKEETPKKDDKDLGLGVVKTSEQQHVDNSKEFAKEANKIGFVDVFPNKFPSEAKYYGADWKFKIKSATLDQDVYDTATALEGLQKYTVDEIRLEKESQLTE